MKRRFVCLGLILAAACGGGEEPPGPPSALADLSGASLGGTVGQQLTEPLRVRVTDADGRGVPGVAVDFTAAVGSGQVTGIPVTTASSGALFSVAAIVDSTDENGEARVRWTLGTGAGEQRVSVTVTGVPTLTILAQATAGEPAELEFRGNSGFIGFVGEPANAVLAVRTVDEFTNPVAGVAITWSALGGGGVAPASGETDEAGVHETTPTLGPTHGLQSFDVRTASLGPDTIQLVAVVGESDPAGDALGVPAGATAADLLRLGATLFDGIFVFSLEFGAPVIPPPPGGGTAGNNTVARIEIDADGDPTTGTRQQQACIGAGADSLGVDFFIEVDPSSPLRTLFPPDLPPGVVFVVDIDSVDADDTCFPVTGSVLAIPFSVDGPVIAFGLGQDFLTNAGVFDVAVVAGVPTAQGQFATDFLPDTLGTSLDVTGGVSALNAGPVRDRARRHSERFPPGLLVTGVNLRPFALRSATGSR